MLTALIIHLGTAPSYAALAAVAALAGAFVWVWFWIREDDHPEPWRLILLAFVTGAVIVPFVIPLQRFAQEIYAASPTSLVFSWALIEELYKYGAALLLILWRRDVDEPIDYVIYMIMVAIGFSAFENMLYMYKVVMELTGGTIAPLLHTQAGAELIRTGMLRFAGASLVHILASATVGIAMAWAFFSSQRTRLLAGLLGLSTATALHGLFNVTIMATTQHADASVGYVFLGVWVSVIAVLLIVERIKRACD